VEISLLLISVKIISLQKITREVRHSLSSFTFYQAKWLLCFQVRQNSSKFVATDSEWTAVRATPVEPLEYFELNGLQPDTDYQLVMRVRNKLGWSNYSSSYFVFHTPEGI